MVVFDYILSIYLYLFIYLFIYLFLINLCTH